MTLLRLDNVGCERDGRQLFERLALRLEPGEGLELTGANGSGKSTLLRCICGLYPDYQGTIEVATVEYLGHKPGISGALSPLENLRWYAEVGSSARVPADLSPGLDARLLEVIDRVGMAGYEHAPCQTLSAGQQRRVALSRLLLGEASLWLLDEPLTALDPPGQALVCDLLREHLQRGGAAIWATHSSLALDGVTGLHLGGAV